MKLFWCCFDSYYTCNTVIKNVVYTSIHNSVNFTDLKTNKQMNTNRKCCPAQTGTMVESERAIRQNNEMSCLHRSDPVMLQQLSLQKTNSYWVPWTFSIRYSQVTRKSSDHQDAVPAKQCWVVQKSLGRVVLYKCFSPSLEWCLHSL